MGVRILHDHTGTRSQAALFCSTTDWAFGPVFSDDGEHDADERAEAFCRWLRVDPRKFTDAELQAKYSAWLAQETAQWELETAEAARDDEDDA